ncbi:MAG: hypothetical protein M3Q98_00140 [Actinomycetota bacterium]|nr:hypothetical protein [Actinomycetota bacterium]
MPDLSEGLPRHPPHTDPPPPRNRGLIVVWSIVIACVVLFFAFVATFVVVYAGHDRIELIEDDAIYAALDEPCANLRSAEKKHPVVGTNEQRAGALLDQVAAGESIVKALDSLDADLVRSDHPTAAWTKDWRTLLRSVSGYANKLTADESAVFTMPVTPDGYSIVGRMDYAIEPHCTVPSSFSALDPLAKMPQ